MSSIATKIFQLPASAASMHDLPAPGTLRELTGRLARGDDVAWFQFHRDFGPRIFHQLLAATKGDYATASEALQQTYLRVARYVKPCDSEPTFRAWLRTVSQSALHDCWRRRAGFWRMLRRHHEEPVDLFSTEAEEQQLFDNLQKSLALLDDVDRALLEDKYYRGRDVRTIAGTMGLSSKAVESRLTRARAELRRRLLEYREQA